MKTGHFLVASAAGALLWNGVGLAREIKGTPLLKKDRRIFTKVYQGTAQAAHDYEFAETTVTFSVACKDSEKAVKDAINPDSENTWAAINKIVPEVSSNDEKRGKKWGKLTITPTRAYNYVPSGTRQKNGKEVPPVAVLKHVCSGKEVKPGDKNVNLNAYVYFGTQTYVVRSENIATIEGLVQKLNEIKAKHQKEEKNRPDALSIEVMGSTDGITYGLTPSTKASVLQKMVDAARENATAKGSQFDVDRTTLHLAQAHPVDFAQSVPYRYFPESLGSIKEGATPKFSLKVDLVYTFWGKVKDAIDKEDSRTEESVSEFQISGRGEAPADFATTTISFSKDCLENPEEKAFGDDSQEFKKVLEAARAFHKETVEEKLANLKRDKKPAPDKQTLALTDKVTPSDLTSNRVSDPFKPWEWGNEVDTATGEFPITAYLNTCTGEVVKAPAKKTDLPTYYEATRSIEVKSSNFGKLYAFTKKQQGDFPVREARNAVNVEVSEPRPDLLPVTKSKLAVLASKDANECAVSPKGPAADRARSIGLDQVHCIGVTTASVRPIPRPAGLTQHARAMAPGAAQDKAVNEAVGGAAPGLDITPVVKKDGERRIWSDTYTFDFTYKLVTEDYLKLDGKRGGWSTDEKEKKKEAAKPKGEKAALL